MSFWGSLACAHPPFFLVGIDFESEGTVASGESHAVSSRLWLADCEGKQVEPFLETRRQDAARLSHRWRYALTCASTMRNIICLDHCRNCSLAPRVFTFSITCTHTQVIRFLLWKLISDVWYCLLSWVSMCELWFDRSFQCRCHCAEGGKAAWSGRMWYCQSVVYSAERKNFFCQSHSSVGQWILTPSGVFGRFFWTALAPWCHALSLCVGFFARTQSVQGLTRVGLLYMWSTCTVAPADQARCAPYYVEDPFVSS